MPQELQALGDVGPYRGLRGVGWPLRLAAGAQGQPEQAGDDERRRVEGEGQGRREDEQPRAERRCGEVAADDRRPCIWALARCRPSGPTIEGSSARVAVLASVSPVPSRNSAT